MAQFNTKSFMNHLKDNSIVRSYIPLGFRACAPTVKIENDKIFLTVPFAKQKTNGNIDGTQIFPIAYAITFIANNVAKVPEELAAKGVGKKEIFPGKFVAFRTLALEPECKDIDYKKPIGTFRHEAVKKYNKEEYTARIDTLYSSYDKIINAAFDGKDADINAKIELKQLLGELVLPEQKSMYKYVDAKFFEMYL